MRHAGFFQHLAGGDEIRSVETELRVLATARRPFAGTLAVQTHANSDYRFESEVKLLAGIDDLFDHFAQLIDLDRKNAAIRTFVAKLGDGVLKRQVDRLDPVTKQVLKTNDERKTQSARARLIYNFENVNAAAVVLKRFG